MPDKDNELEKINFKKEEEKGKKKKKDKCKNGGIPGPQGPPGPPGPQGPPGESGGIANKEYGFAYSPSISTNSGPVQLTIASPISDNMLFRSNGLLVLRAGIYQISYKVIATLEDENSEAIFQLLVNDSIQVASSRTKLQKSDTSPKTTSTLSATVSMSLLENDLVKLIAMLPNNASYEMPTLQITQLD
ncbi:hypothetical protein D8M04_13130 [Oceanobacillus piezotolerans]|uniref:Collagen-like protein n=1 Tax=Oceanobacillus piezotolerans TaxID=2448030 RepID=A0A498D4S9_9BACI|nr:hypothetical protein [Oceanobacillus piezotolerans]RLL43846.1 hypothetical protein D8M04_13130 [Oceanobacillus piezotolerans]